MEVVEKHFNFHVLKREKIKSHLSAAISQQQVWCFLFGTVWIKGDREDTVRWTALVTHASCVVFIRNIHTGWTWVFSIGVVSIQNRRKNYLLILDYNVTRSSYIYDRLLFSNLLYLFNTVHVCPVHVLVGFAWHHLPGSSFVWFCARVLVRVRVAVSTAGINWSV